MDATGVSCGTCGAEVHADCAEELGRCPTLACEGKPGGASGGLAGAAPTRAERRALRIRHRERREQVGANRPREQWLTTDGARRGIYARLLHSAFWHGLIFLTVLGLSGWALFDSTIVTHTGGVRMMSSDDATALAVFLGLFGFALVSYSGWWLYRIPRVWRECTRLLDETQPIRMRLKLETRGSGKNATTHALLQGAGRRLEYGVGGLLTPYWFKPGYGVPKNVLVYGADDPETPVIVELPDGGLVLIQP